MSSTAAAATLQGPDGAAAASDGRGDQGGERPGNAASMMAGRGDRASSGSGWRRAAGSERSLPVGGIRATAAPVPFVFGYRVTEDGDEDEPTAAKDKDHHDGAERAASHTAGTASASTAAAAEGRECSEFYRDLLTTAARSEPARADKSPLRGEGSQLPPGPPVKVVHRVAGLPRNVAGAQVGTSSARAQTAATAPRPAPGGGSRWDDDGGDESSANTVRRGARSLPRSEARLAASQQRAANAQLLRAAQDGNLDVVRQLVVGGAEINTQDAFGWTPLMSASFAGQADTVAWLLSKAEGRAGVELADEAGVTALSLATEVGRGDIVAIIRASLRGGHGGSKRKQPPAASEAETIEAKHGQEQRHCDVCGVDVDAQAWRAHVKSTAHLFDAHKGAAQTPLFGIPKHNVGFRMLRKAGWTGEGGLGPAGKEGRVWPVRTVLKQDKRGLGLTKAKARVTHFAPGDATAVQTQAERTAREHRERRAAAAGVAAASQGPSAPLTTPVATTNVKAKDKTLAVAGPGKRRKTEQQGGKGRSWEAKVRAYLHSD